MTIREALNAASWHEGQMQRSDLTPTHEQKIIVTLARALRLYQWRYGDTLMDEVADIMGKAR
jgi:hypothetical protein